MTSTQHRERYNQMSPEERSGAAERLLRDPVLLAILEECQEDEVNNWKTGQTTTERENAHHRLKALDALVGKLSSTIEDVRVRAASMERKGRVRS